MYIKLLIFTLFITSKCIRKRRNDSSLNKNYGKDIWKSIFNEIYSIKFQENINFF